MTPVVSSSVLGLRMPVYSSFQHTRALFGFQSRLTGRNSPVIRHAHHAKDHMNERATTYPLRTTYVRPLVGNGTGTVVTRDT